ncbi:MAG TPA: di-heme oxidoredictase family protein [Thermoanaerobaculia bacterium]|nr:di-heme oxidoredictase family protein [Thermoanaerobaculia bacterium]
MKQLLVAFLLLSSLSLEAQRRRPSAPPLTPQPIPNVTFGSPLPNLSAEHLAQWNAGRREFVDRRTMEEGLGPVFNGRSCGECHNAPAAGGGAGRFVTRIAAIVDNVYHDLTEHGGALLQGAALSTREGASHDFRNERVPASATIIARRRSIPLFGLGLVDATDDATFIALAQQQGVQSPATAGRVALVRNIVAGMKTVGKFGWKAQIATLQEFSGDAYLNELGITNPLFPDENCPAGDCAELAFNPVPGLNDTGERVDRSAAFMRFLGPPPRGRITAEVTAGEAVFSRIGCDSCHTPTLQTGPNANPALHRVTYHPYSDFLLHDMGPLGDRIEQEAARGTEMRTPPLWGLRAVGLLLHDGSARSIDEAILKHDGQGRGARDRFEALNETDRAHLLAFLRSL